MELVTSGYALDKTLRALDVPEQRSRLARLTIDVTIVLEATESPPERDKLAEKDHPILAAAIATKATHLLTGDRTHFGRVCGKTLGGVTILRPAEYPGSGRQKRR